MSATATHRHFTRPLPPIRRLPEPSTPPRLIPKRGQVLRNVLRTVFSCLFFTGEGRRPSRKTSMVSPVYT
ncbi:hypothetical protein L1987_10858 [Smallanthus sonchifolius]|uniref:Uncharacterized protein n=1 Tax=Smallanthus sonchifolius TaxID=185202 RepID=A0ACB9JAA9_9ASTR|nr:hypothetical protein L1987_10858 [Smallanthus sonchifolius]